MSTTWSFEKRKSFSVPYEEIFRKCEHALKALNLNVTASDESSGLIEAEKPAKWPFKSDQRISITVHRDSKVTAIGKLNIGLLNLNALSDQDPITEKFFEALKGMF